MSVTTIRQRSQLAFWSWSLFLGAIGWRVIAGALKFEPPVIGGIVGLAGTAGAVAGLVGCLPGNDFRWLAFLGLVCNAVAAAYFTPWILTGL